MGEEVISSCCGRTAQRQVLRRNGFGRDKRKRFLSMLAASCNVQMSAAHAAVAVTTVYLARRRDAAFASAWDAALAAGYDRLEAALVSRAIGTAAMTPADAEALADPEALLPAEQIDAELGLKLLARHRARIEGGAAEARPGRHIATEEETNAALIKRLDVLRRQIEARK